MTSWFAIALAEIRTEQILREKANVNSVNGFTKMIGRPPLFSIYSHKSDMLKGYNFSMEDTRKGFSFVKNNIHNGKGLEQSLIASPPAPLPQEDETYFLLCSTSSIDICNILQPMGS